MRRLVLFLALLAPLFAVSGAHAQPVSARLSAAMRHAGPFSGAYVLDATSHKVIYQSRASRPRILASNTKLFTSSAILAKLGPEATFATELRSDGTRDPISGVFTGDVYLHGGGDPTFGTSSFVRRFFGSGSTIEQLADSLENTGITEIDGRILGDESRFDSARGIPDSRFGFDSDLGGPLSALTFDRGLANERGTAIQTNPPLFAARALKSALKGRDIRITGRAGVGETPSDANVLASVDSPPLATILKLQNKESDNFFAETLLKDLAASSGAQGTTRRGAAAAVRFARRLHSRVRMVDGSGLDRRDQAAPKEVVDLLDAMRNRDPDEFTALLDSLPIAGRDGTLQDRMRRGSARGRCHAKTGTLSDVSTLSGYCFARGGDVIEFSLLMNRVNVLSAHRIQDRMVNAIAGFSGAARRAAAPRTLDEATARKVANAFASDCGACETGVTDCARLSSTRIDCVTAEEGSCDDVVSTSVRRGYLWYDLYPCKSDAPATAAAQVQASPPGGLQYEPLTPAPFDFKEAYPKGLPYPKFPVRRYRGRTSQRFEHADLWVRPNRRLLRGSGLTIAASCFHGAQFVPLGGAQIRNGELTVVKRRASGGYPAFRLHGRVVAHGKRIGGSLRLLHLSCAKKPITFSAKLIGKPGF